MLRPLIFSVEAKEFSIGMCRLPIGRRSRVELVPDLPRLAFQFIHEKESTFDLILVYVVSIRVASDSDIPTFEQILKIRGCDEGQVSQLTERRFQIEDRLA